MKYTVTIPISYTVSYEVEAEDADAAEKLALDLWYQSPRGGLNPEGATESDHTLNESFDITCEET